jgi:hypothetical protein
MLNGKSVERNGNVNYYKKGQLHREVGPALEFQNGTKFWYINGMRHREDGPACEWSNGDKEWYLNGKNYTEDEFNGIMLEKKLKLLGF